jgi:lipopolysaccharide export system protein LptA
MRVAAFVCVAMACLVSPLAAQDAAVPATQVQTSVTQPAKGSGLDFTSGKCKGATNIASDSFEGDFQTKVGIYSGNVIVTQADCKLRADKVVAEASTGKDINRLTASGNVVFDSSSGTAIGDNGVYELGPKTITLTGKVVLTKGKNVMRGTLLVVNLNTGLAHLTAKGMAGGRVQSTLVPADKGETVSKKPSKSKAGVSN